MKILQYFNNCTIFGLKISFLINTSKISKNLIFIKKDKKVEKQYHELS